jgi:hypothetical protein
MLTGVVISCQGGVSAYYEGSVLQVRDTCPSWNPGYTDPGRFGWRGAEGVYGAARAVSGEEAEEEVKKVFDLARGGDNGA